MTKKIFTFIIAFFISFSQFVYSSSLSENVYLSIDAKTGATYIEKEANKKVYPASTTKVLTCILALENLNLNDTVTVTREMLNKVPVGSSTMKLVANETLTVEQLLYGLMLPSGNDAAVVLAYKISGSIDEFSNLMNKKAAEIGCENTNFTCPHGFHDENHYTTARDMSKILMYALKNDTFLKLIRTKYYTIPANGTVSYDRKYTNTNTLLENNDYVICGKTGYTDEAGNVFISYSEKDDFKIINILYDGKKGYYDGNYRFEDTKFINNYIFSNYSKKNIIDEQAIKISYIDYNLNYKYSYFNDDPLKLIVKKDDLKSISYILKEQDIDNIKLSLNISSKGYLLNNYEYDIPEKKYETISNNYSLINIIKIIIVSFLDLLFIIILFKCIITIIKNRKLRKKIINKKYY